MTCVYNPSLLWLAFLSFSPSQVLTAEFQLQRQLVCSHAVFRRSLSQILCSPCTRSLMFQEETRTSFFLPYLREPAPKLKMSPVQLRVAVCNALHFLSVKTRRKNGLRAWRGLLVSRRKGHKVTLTTASLFPPHPRASLSRWMRPSGPWTEQQHRTSSNATGRGERELRWFLFCKTV